MSAFINNDTPEEQAADNISENCKNKSELAYVNRMKSKYGDDKWMWKVEYTEEDCYLADMHREWLYKRGGAYPTFNTYENHGYPLDDDEKYEEYDDEEYEEDQKEKIENEEDKFVFFMKAFYGSDDWCWLVKGTEKDGPVAVKYRKIMYEKGLATMANNDEESKKICRRPGFRDTFALLEKAVKEDELEAANIEKTNQIEKEKKKQEDKIHYKMQGLYGNEWWWAVVNTEHDCELAVEHRRLDREKFREEDEQRRRDNF